MRFAGVLFFIIQVLLSSSLAAQSHGADSAITDSAREETHQSAKREFKHWQDSVQAERIRKDVAKNGRPLDAFLQDMKEQERVRAWLWYSRIGLGVLFIVVLTVSFLRRNRQRRSRINNR